MFFCSVFCEVHTTFAFLPGIQVSSCPTAPFCHPILLLVSTDLPARAMVTCLKQYNGRCSCIYCEQVGTSVAGQVCWPYEETVNIRSKKSLVQDAKSANEENAPVRLFLLGIRNQLLY